MTTEQQRVVTRKVTMVVIASAHFALALLGVVNRLNFTVAPEYRLLRLLADSNMWVGIHLIAAVFVAISLVLNRFQIQSLSYSAGFMGCWALFNLLWGLNAVTPVSLAGPILGVAVSGVSYSVAMSWATGGHDKGH